jgi:PIN domain nuclease of toxin-antitoxin system
MHHRDPFDHLLMAQAIVEGAVFVSEDRHNSEYGIQVVGCGKCGLTRVTVVG